MKKVILLAVVSTFSAVAFSQSVGSEPTGVKPKNLKTVTQSQTNSPNFTNVNGVNPNAKAVAPVVIDAKAANVVPVAQATDVVKPAAIATGVKPVATHKAVKRASKN